jgi:transcriptional regulator of acetoin/glycerol metabolism
MDTGTITAASSRRPGTEQAQPAIVLLIDRARPLAGGARHSLANIDQVRIGRGRSRAVERIMEDGRPTIQISLPDDRVSTVHARIERRSEGWRLVDCGSTNGCRVNRSEVQATLLADGDVLEIGQTFFRYHAALPTSFGEPGDVDAADLSGFSRAIGTLLPRLARELETLRRIAQSDVSVLLQGQTGTGKEVLARAIHAESGRTGPFVALNCSALPTTLVESLLFGHTRGAFSGATQDAPGLVRAAQGGTLFLDEIGAVPLDLQAKLLRVVEEGQVRPLGAEAGVPIDVRLVAATCEPLEAMVEGRRFRADLYERLAVCVVVVPPLRDRPEDIPALARHLLAASDLEGRSVAPDALAALRAHRWPGNVRELRNVLVQAAVSAGQVLEAEQVAAVLAERTGRTRRIEAGEALRIFEEAGRNVSAAARRADLPRTSMRDLLRSAGVSAWPRR